MAPRKKAQATKTPDATTDAAPAEATAPTTATTADDGGDTDAEPTAPAVSKPSEPKARADKGGDNRDDGIRAAFGKLFAGKIDVDAFEKTPGLFDHGWMGNVVRAIDGLTKAEQKVTKHAVADALGQCADHASAKAFCEFLGF